jgi:arylsulfatase A-like enzyme
MSTDTRRPLRLRYGMGVLCLCLLVACVGFRLSLPEEGAESGRTRPNIILILVDDLGWSDLGSYGSTFYRTPRLDEFAASGVRFTHAYSASSACSPTRASILTGRYPLRIGFTEPSGNSEGERKHQLQYHSAPFLRAIGPSSTNHLAEHYYTLGEAMKDAGYSTAFLGKWHLGRTPHIPEMNGFDFVVGGRHHPGPPGKNPQRVNFPPWDGDTFPASTQALDMHIDDYLAQRAAEFITAHRDKPFFMCFWPYSVHSPFQAEPELLKKWQARVDPANPQRNPVMAAMMEVLDTSVGHVLDAVKENGLEQNTIVIFTSDNGGNMYEQVGVTTATNNAPLRSGKGSNHDGGVRVPMIVRWPGVTQPGSVSDALVTSTDHYPTILEMAGLSSRPDDHKDGFNYAPALRGEEFERPFMLSDAAPFIFQTANVANTSIRENNWKLVRYWYDKDPQTHRYALFDTDADIGEDNNLADTYPQKVAYLSAQMDDYLTDNDILLPMPNANYNGRSVGLWTSEGPGKLASKNGTLVLTSDSPGFAATTPFVPWVSRSSFFEFEARAKGTHRLSVDWQTNAAKPGKLAANHGQEVTLSAKWRPYRVKLRHDGILRGLRVAPSGRDYTVEIRAARVLSPDRTEMMAYEFH